MKIINIIRYFMVILIMLIQFSFNCSSRWPRVGSDCILINNQVRCEDNKGTVISKFMGR
jgi:hypothetical protein